MSSPLLLNRKPKGVWVIPVALSLFAFVALVLGVSREVALYNAKALCPEQDVAAAIEAGRCKQAKSRIATVNKLYPSVPEMLSSAKRNFLLAEGRRGAPERVAPLQSPMGKATIATLSRFLPGVFFAMLIAFLLAMIAASSGYAGLSIGGFSLAMAYVPAIALTPFFFSFPGNAFHIAIVAFGLTPVLLRDLVLFIQTLPESQLIKAQTLKANTFTIILRVLVPQSIPRLIDSTRVAMGLGWILVIAAEFVIAQEGIGLRIWKLKRRYDVDNLLPIVIWVTLLAIAVDLLLWAIKRYGFPWTKGAQQ